MSPPSLETNLRWRGLRATTAAVTGTVLIAAFVLLNLTFAVQRGVCCADDGAYAVIAKNLANGNGYTLTVGYGDPNYSARPFDPEVGIGPALVLPVAVAVRFFGNKSWVPGVAQVTVSALLLLAIFLNLRRILGTAETAAALGVFCWIVYAVSPYHLEQWYAMLGEVPAALTAILAITVWAAGPSSSLRLFAAGLLLSVAFLFKLLALVYFAAALGGAAVIGVLAHKRPLADACRPLPPLLIGAALPQLAFELWKVSVLGGRGYLVQLRELFGFVERQGASEAGLTATAMTARLLVFDERFAVSLTGLLVLALFGYYLAAPRRDASWRHFYLVLLAGATLQFGYWLLLSLGWPRYAYMALIAIVLLLVLPLFAIESRGARLLYAAALVLTLLPTAGRIAPPIRSLSHTGFAASEQRHNQEKVVAFLAPHEERRPFIARWWAPVSDLEFLLPGAINFRGYRALTADDRAGGFLLIRNDRFDNTQDPDFELLVGSCGTPVLIAAPYSVYDCAATTTPDTTEGEP